MSALRIDVLGAGSVGLAVAGRLSDARDVSVRLRARSVQRAARLTAEGFTLHDERSSRRRHVPAVGPSAAAGSEGRPPGSADPTDASPADVLLAAVKCPDTAAAAADHADAVGPATAVITMQNGLGADAILRAAFGERVVVAVTTLGAHRTDDGVRLVSAGRTFVGPTRASAPASESASPLELVRARFIGAMNLAGLPAEPVDDVAAPVWRKLLINAAINAPATLRDCRNGQLLDDPDTVSLMRDVLAEGLAVAAAVGVRPFEGLDAAEAQVHAVARATAGNLCSMLADRRAGRPTEIDFINGAIVALGDKHGAPATVNRNLVRLVKAATLAGDGRAAHGRARGATP